MTATIKYTVGDKGRQRQRDKQTDRQTDKHRPTEYYIYTHDRKNKKNNADCQYLRKHISSNPAEYKIHSRLCRCDC